ncbi:MAG TPA: hypothetical protein VF466_02255 [Candidatus Saccharimonadales bacterium]
MPPKDDQPDQPPADEAEAEDSPLDDDRTDRAVDDIVAREGDELLAVQDAAAERASHAAPRRGFWGTIGHGFALWLGTAKGRWLTFILLVLISGGVAAVPEARYFALNTAGVRASASIPVVDDITQLPLKGVTVTVAGQSKETDAKGVARFTKLRLGKTDVTVSQPGFALIRRHAVLGWGSNPLDQVSLTATGARYAIVVQDYLSGKPLAGVLATAGDSTALSDDQGKIELTLENPSAAGLQVTLSKDGYRTEQTALKAPNQTAAATLVTSRKAVFLSKASGVYDLYKSDIDGANKEVLLPGTGNENGNLTLVVSPDGSHAALVSTRDNQHDADGYLLSTLTMIDVEQGTASTLSHADQIQLIDWIGSRLVFEQVSSDPKTPPASRSTVVSYDYVANSRVQLAAAPKLSGVFSAQGAMYYAIAADDNNGSLQPALYRINPDGTNRQNVYSHEVWSGLRTDYNTLALQTADGWIGYNLKTGAAAAIAGPSSYTSRLYRDNADHSRSLWVNQGVLMLSDTVAGKDTPVQTQSGLTYPVQWLGDDAAIFRVVTSNETADYATALSAGAVPHKIADVANTYGFSSGQ